MHKDCYEVNMINGNTDGVYRLSIGVKIAHTRCKHGMTLI